MVNLVRVNSTTVHEGNLAYVTVTNEGLFPETSRPIPIRGERGCTP